MGDGFRVFDVGEVLTASNVMNYLMDQSVMSFASAGARDAAITAPEEGMIAVLRDVDIITVYTGTAWRALGYYGGSAWSTWTPQWTADSGTTTLGNGELVGRYVQLGSIVFYSLRFTWGGTTTQSVIGGNWLFSLPVDAYNGLISTWSVSTAWLLDISSGTRYMANAYVDGSASPARVGTITPHGTVGTTDGQTPFTWAQNDRLNVFGFYEVA